MPDRWVYRVDKNKRITKINHLSDLFEPFYTYPILRKSNQPVFKNMMIIMREAMWEGHTIYRPSRQYKLKTFNVDKPEQVREDELVIENEYLKENPRAADIRNDLPTWSKQLRLSVNRTDERLDLLGKIINQRIPNSTKREAQGASKTNG